MKVCVFTLGCKVNEVESASVMSAAKSWGAEVTDRLCPADIYVLNTCAVTCEAEKKSRQAVARIRRFNPAAPIYVMGCASQKNAAAFEERGVKYIGGARERGALIDALAEVCGEHFDSHCNGQGYEILPAPRAERTRAFIKIEDGCNNFCSYCIIPYLRGRVRSRSAEDILREAEQSSCPEVVLTGINISAYSYGETNLDGLLRSLNKLKKRVRLGSLECGVIDKNLLEACGGLCDFAPQFHLSLQSGSDAVLQAMNRRYNRTDFLEKCALIYSYFPEAAITTDIIAGFPTESEADFADSLSIIEEAKFARVHAFAYSPREGTAAFKLKDIRHEIKQERLHRLISAAEEAANSFIARNIGTLQDVIFEDMEGEHTVGYTGSYIKVYCVGDLRGRTARVRLTEAYKDGAKAELCPAEIN